MKVRTVFMGTPQFAVPMLESLVTSTCQVVAVYTQPDRPAGRGHRVAVCPVKKAALARGLPVIQRQSLKPREAVEELAGFQPDLIVVAAYALILRAEVLALPAFGCLNVHFSLLPRHRGAAPVASAILCGDETTGVTIILMDSGMDTGQIVAQEQVRVSPEDTTESLSFRLADAGAVLLLKALPGWLGGELKPQTQDESRATYSRPIAAKDGEIDWSLSAIDLWRRVRAYSPWPGSYTWWQGRRLKIHEAFPVEGSIGGEPGKVIALAEPAGAGVITGDGILHLVRVQVEGRQRMSADDFVRGQRDFVGSVLGGGSSADGASIHQSR
jgi:methionyl-tRNA formyltransferase